jgi:septal ring factor EnvC (AmiA/AmiB activator)
MDERIRSLEIEAARLASQSRTLIGDIRKLEIARDLRMEEARRAQAAADEGRAQFEQTTARLQALEAQRLAGLPELKAQLVQVYKRGEREYLRLLLSANGLRDFGRVSRAVSALAYREERAIRDHRQTLEQLRTERDQLAAETRILRARTEAARAASTLAEQAVAARTALIAQIDSRRDLTAQYVGELQDARAKLQQQLRTGGPAAVQAVSAPLGPFRGGLEWPVAGVLTGRFGQPSPASANLVRDGVEISAPAGTLVRAVHAGTVSYADSFTGLGTLVIVDHGDDNHSLYGYLADVDVERGQRVEAGGTVGRVGISPGGTPALYFEMRIDGRLADPVQWLKPR